MTHQQFGWWMEENGYLDRVAKWGNEPGAPHRK